MDIIQKPNEIINRKITIPEGDNYRWITYIYKIVLDNFILLYNFLNNSLIRLTKEEYDNYLNIEELKTLLFVVPEDYPEYDIYKYFFKYFSNHIDYNIQENLCSYTILNTSKCNARCNYCYENGMKREHMSDHTLDNLIRLIKENYKNNKKKVHIGMFGGEPFFYQKVYDKIFQSLKDDGIPYKSNFISNGYLINDKLVKKLKEFYNCQSGQIPLDGTEENYNRIKNFIYKKDPSPFQTVLKNIKNLISNKIVVSIRINFDPKDYKDKEELLDFLKEELKDFDNNYYNIYFHELFGEYSIECQYDIIDIVNRNNYLNNYRSKNLIPQQMPVEKCMSDSLYSIVINSNGDLYKCENLPKDGCLGNLNDFYDKGIQIDTNKVNTFYKNYIEYPECKNCNLKIGCLQLNFCSGFYKNSCSLTEKNILDRNTKKFIMNTYNKWLGK